MRAYLILYSLFLCVFASCQKPNKYAKQIAVADSLIHALYAYDTVKVSTLTGVDPERIGEDKLGYMAKLGAAKEVLQKAGIPKKDDYTIKEYPVNSADLVDVIVTLKSSGGIITIRFVKFLPLDKIAFFRLETPITLEKTIAPPPSKNN